MSPLDHYGRDLVLGDLVETFGPAPRDAFVVFIDETSPSIEVAFVGVKPIGPVLVDPRDVVRVARDPHTSVKLGPFMNEGATREQILHALLGFVIEQTMEMENLTDDPAWRAKTFAKHFWSKADLSVRLHGEGRHDESLLVVTTAIGALGELWLSLFPDEEKQLRTEFGGTCPESIQMSRVLQRFSDDPNTAKVAVPVLAEDMLVHMPSRADEAREMMKRSRPPGTSAPLARLDLPVDGLVAEFPSLGGDKQLRRVMEEYTYGAFLYRYVRCSVAHLSARSKRTHNSAGTNEISYRRSKGRTQLGFGPDLLASWLRGVATGYADACLAASKDPGPDDIDAVLDAGRKLAAKWKAAAGAKPPTLSDEVTKELRAAGCTEDLVTPNGTMGFGPESFDTAAKLAEFLEQMVHRRENLWRTNEAVGVEAATKSRVDVEAVIAALKAVLGTMAFKPKLS